MPPTHWGPVYSGVQDKYADCNAVKRVCLELAFQWSECLPSGKESHLYWASHFCVGFIDQQELWPCSVYLAWWGDQLAYLFGKLLHQWSALQHEITGETAVGYQGLWLQFCAFVIRWKLSCLCYFGVSIVQLSCCNCCWLSITVDPIQPCRVAAAVMFVEFHLEVWSFIALGGSLYTGDWAVGDRDGVAMCCFHGVVVIEDCLWR